MRLAIFLIFSCTALAIANGAEPARGIADRELADYFRAETAALAERSLTDVATLEDWTSRRDEYRRQLAEMLGLDPLPRRTDLKPTSTGKHETAWFTVENLHFQSRPGLYVTANLYLPKGLDKPAPAVLYVCGHALVKKDGVSFGNKTHYQHHGGWFARNGYVCLTIDTLQLGEIEGLHHGTYREGMWWWNSRGYTPAGVEAWNCVRALDYLQSRPEVDGQRLGVTGRSGGGAYSWWIAALDERIKAAAPTAGITDLENHVVDGCVEGHCDCMFMVNTYRWDYPQVAALVAPRPLLIVNTDSDPIFPLNGVERLHAKVRHLYQLHDADNKLGLQISTGGHKDTQELQVAVFRWFNRHLKNDETSLIADTGITYFTPEELRVFRDGLPNDQINTRIQESFVAAAEPPLPRNQEDWTALRDSWQKALREKCFRGWPDSPGPLNLKEIAAAEQAGKTARVYEFDSQAGVRLRLYVCQSAGTKDIKKISFSIGTDSPTGQATQAHLRSVLGDRADELGSSAGDVELAKSEIEPGTAMMLCFPRGVGPRAWAGNEKKQVQIRRRFMLLGQTLAGMQAWDVRRGVQAARELVGSTKAGVDLWAGADLSVPAVYASLFEPSPLSLGLDHPPASHGAGPDVLNVLRFLDLPQAMALAADGGVSVRLLTPTADDWRYPAEAAKNLGWPSERFVIQPAD
ncbi:MAG TPA: prolyl oligopeptidase family serine peptidase [Pirellulales bacterium]